MSKPGFISCRKLTLRSPESSCNATRTSLQNRNGIPWPALTKSKPTGLKRTASTLMSEWERSLATKAHDRADPLAPTNERTG